MRKGEKKKIARAGVREKTLILSGAKHAKEWGRFPDPTFSNRRAVRSTTAPEGGKKGGGNFGDDLQSSLTRGRKGNPIRKKIHHLVEKRENKLKTSSRD